MSDTQAILHEVFAEATRLDRPSVLMVPVKRAVSEAGSACIEDGRRALDNEGFARDVADLASVMARLGVGQATPSQ